MVLILILIVIVAIVIAVIAVQKSLNSKSQETKSHVQTEQKFSDFGTNATTSSSTTQTSSNFTDQQQVRKITYSVKTRGSTSNSSKSFRGTSTSTVTKTFGTRAGDGKVVTSMSELTSISPGTRIRFAGIITGQNPTLIHNFVACAVEEFRGLNDNSEPIWRTSKTETPPLFIELAGETLQVINNNYGMTIKGTEKIVNGYVQGRPIYYPQEDNLVCDEIADEYSQRFCGIELGDNVIVTGTVIEESPIVISAENIALTI